MKISLKLLAIVGLVALAGAAYWLQNRPAPSNSVSGDAARSAGASASGAGAGSGGGRRGEGGPPPVEVAKVVQQKLEDDVRAVGTLRSNQGVMMRPEVAGRIQRLGFGDGQRVQRGQLLVQLDDSLQQAQLLQSKAQAGIARTNLQRSRDLAAENFLSQSAVDQAAATLAVAEAQVSLSEAQLARMKIVAPFDAVAGIRLVNVGDYVKDGADLVNLEDISSMWLDFRLPERVIGRIRPGTVIEAELDAQPGSTFKGQVDAVDAQVDANGRAMLVRARVRNPGLQLKSGMFARVRAVMGTREKALVVPEEALVPQGTKQYLYKIVPGEKGPSAQREEVVVGMRLPGVVEVTGKLQAGDTVVTAGQSRLGRGAEAVPVKVVDLNRPGGAKGADRAASGAGREASGAVSAENAASRL